MTVISVQLKLKHYPFGKSAAGGIRTRDLQMSQMMGACVCSKTL